MKEDGVVADSQAFKGILDSFIRSGKFDSALEILDCMEQLGATLNPQMFNSVLIALVRNNQVRFALFIFLKLLDAESNGCGDVGFAPNSFKKVFERLRKKKEFKFDIRGYNICIYAFGCWGDLSTSLSLFKEMRERESMNLGVRLG
ncbi:hypothetical protein K1719_008706 [Acacia pycnantha]|nr:hypothetical protein K1719_008706 [Acacia pycnantha]